MDNEEKLGDLKRRLVGIEKYWTLKQSGSKHAEALKEAARLTAIETRMPMSATELRRVLAQMQPKGWNTVYTVKRQTPEEVNADLLRYPEGSMPRKLAAKNPAVYVFGFGPRPSVPRSNAKETKRKP